MTERYRLLQPDEPAPVTMLRENGNSPFFLACDHAGKRIPERLGDLGLSASDRDRHIAWDIGAENVARHLSDLLDAALAIQNYSRLVIDCNRDPRVPESIARVSESTAIPGNHDLMPDHAAARAEEIFHPYHNRIVQTLDRRHSNGLPNVLIAIHSFTPVFKGKSRPWHVGVLYNRDTRLANSVMRTLEAHGDLCVGDNEPYRISDETDYTIPVHGEQRGIVHVEFEIRQDLITEDAGQIAWAERLRDVLMESLIRLDGAAAGPEL